MAEEFLDVAEVGVVFEQVRGAGVPPEVGGDFLFDARLAGVFFDDGSEAVFAEGVAEADGDEEGAGLEPAQHVGADGFEVGFEVAAGLAGEWDDAVFAAFAFADDGDFIVEVHVVDGEREDFLFSDAGGVEDFEDGAVAVAFERGRVGSLDDLAGFLRREDVLGKRIGFAGELERGGGVVGDEPFDVKEREQAANERKDAVLPRHPAGLSRLGGQVKQPALEVAERLRGEHGHVVQFGLGHELGQSVEVGSLRDDGARGVVEDL